MKESGSVSQLLLVGAFERRVGTNKYKCHGVVVSFVSRFR